MKAKPFHSILFLTILLIFSCRKDRYHKDELRCIINDEQTSTSYYNTTSVSRTKAKAGAFLDTTNYSMNIQATLGPAEDEYKYSIEFTIDSFNGIGSYNVSKFRANSEINSFQFQTVFFLDKTYDAQIEITNFIPDTKTIIGTFHFVTLNSQKNRMFIRNGLIRMNYETQLR